MLAILIRKSMRDLLPQDIYDEIRDRFVVGVADAEALFPDHAADEDAVTGALGQEIARRGRWNFVTPEGIFYVRINYTKVRGRGEGAPERIYGTDGLFQISVTDAAGRIIRRKGLPFQSKKRWTGREQKVLEQAQDMEATVGPGIIIDFSEQGYRACTSARAIAADGNMRTAAATGEVRPLGQILGNDFLACTIGIRGLFFDVEEERYVGADARPPREVIAAEIVVPARA